MKSLKDLLQRIGITREAVQPIPAGSYRYQAPADAETPFRLHLRVEPDGNGILVVNASTILHLNQTAVEYAYHFVKQTPVDEVRKTISSRYRVSPEEAEKDFIDLRERIKSLITTPDLDPVTFLDFDRRDPYATRLSAPLRTDLALTYRTSQGFSEDTSLQSRVKRELVTEEWTGILKKLWEAGVPHVIFTGGEPTLRPDLHELIQFAEQQGQVTGLISDGLRFSDPHYRHDTLQSGLDHMMFVLMHDEEESWEALRDTLAEDLFITVHVTVTERTRTILTDLLNQLKKMGVERISLSASDQAYVAEMQSARQLAADLGLTLVWDLPVPYSALHPVSVEIGQTAPTGAGNAWIYLEPDAEVLAGQGIQPVLGNLLTDSLESILEKVHTAAEPQ